MYCLLRQLGRMLLYIYKGGKPTIQTNNQTNMAKSEKKPGDKKKNFLEKLIISFNPPYYNKKLYQAIHT